MGSIGDCFDDFMAESFFGVCPLLRLRANTGFAAGWWSVPGGGLESGEPLATALAREAKEEIGVVIDEADLELVVVCHHNDALIQYGW